MASTRLLCPTLSLMMPYKSVNGSAARVSRHIVGGEPKHVEYYSVFLGRVQL